MSIMTFDDGSTLDTDQAGSAGAATQAPPGYLISDYASNFAPSNLTPGASSIADVLRYGFGRLVDYKVASIQAQNTPAQYSDPYVPGGTIGGLSTGTVLIGLAVVVGLAVALGGSGK